jgi:hypothetical protein
MLLCKAISNSVERVDQKVKKVDKADKKEVFMALRSVIIGS